MPKPWASHKPNVIERPEQADAPEPDTAQSGDDARRRGWFWHWNSMVTQYAPLLGLKGIGLLNSYTVWTDRREHSPYQGYAFPSQTSESAFYGEDRAELISINKILVALDLIEIRKEMVQRTVSEMIEQRLLTVRQELLARPVLQRAIEEMGLYPKTIENKGIEAAIEQMGVARRVAVCIGR